jgi:hypothetical protein
VVLLAACGPSTTTPADVTPDPSTVSKIAGRFSMSFTVDRTTLRTGDPITGTASLGLIAGGSGAISGPDATFTFAFVEVGGQNRAVTPVSDAMCAPHQIGNDSPLTSPIFKSGATSGGPNDAFVTEFLKGDDIHLPAGVWDITATADFWDGRACAGQRVLIPLTVRVHVS